MNPLRQNVTVTISRKSLMRIAIFGAIIYALFLLKNLVFVVLTSVVLASFIRTAAAWVKRRLGLNHVLSIVLMYLLTVLVFAAIFYFFIPVLLVEVANALPLLSEYLPTGSPLTENLNLLGDSAVLNPIGQGVEVNTLIGNAQAFLSIIASGFGNTLSALFGGLLNVALVVIISFYLSVSKDGIESFLRIISPVHKEAYVINVWHRAQRKIAFWMQGQVILGVIVGVLTFLGLTLLGVEHAILLSIVAAVFELIPFGIFLAAVPAITLSFASGGISLAIMVLALYLIIQQLEGYLIAPLVVNKVTGVSPLVVILSVLIGVALAGFWGLILAVPVAVTVIEYINDLEKERLLRMQQNV